MSVDSTDLSAPGTGPIPYGEWPSPIAAETVVASSVSLGEVQLAGPFVFWSELRPTEAGRVQIVRCHGRRARSRICFPDGFSARTRVHEYGGRGMARCEPAGCTSANWDDQRLYRLRVGDDGPVGAPEPITPEPPMRHGYPIRRHGAVGPAHRLRAGAPRSARALGEAVNEIVAIDVRGTREPVRARQRPRLRLEPAGVAVGAQLLAWLQWQHPEMPWDTRPSCAWRRSS